MGKGSSAPAVPDPYETASAEAQFNRPDVYSPSGSGVRQGYTDAEGVFQQGVAPEGFQSAQSYIESPFEENIRGQLEPAATNLTGQLITDNVDNLPGPARVGDRGDIAQTIFDRTFSLMAPGIDKANSRLLTNLQGRGIPIGGEAFNETYGEQQTRTQDTISRLAQDADIAAGQEQSRQFGLDSSQRSQSLQELVGLMGGGYNPPNNTPSGSTAGVNYSGLVGQQYDAQLSQYNQQQQQSQATAGAIGSLGAALIKSTIESKDVRGSANTAGLADIVSRLPMAVWQYKDGEGPDGDRAQHVGPMAEHFHALTGLGTSENISVIDYLGVMAGALQNALDRINMLEAERRAYQRVN